MDNIFISYSRGDQAKAHRIAEVLSSQGWPVWWDRKIPPGRSFDEVIEEALDSAVCVVVLWSKESVSSRWVKAEAAEGARREILVPVLIEDVKIPLEFRRLQSANLSHLDCDSFESELSEFLKAVATILGVEVITDKTDSGKTSDSPEGPKESRPSPETPTLGSSANKKDILLATIGLETLGGVSTPILLKGSELPAVESQVFSTATDNQPAITINLTLGENGMASDNVSLGVFELNGIPPAPRAVPQISIQFVVNSNSQLTVTAKDIGTGYGKVFDTVELFSFYQKLSLK